MDVRNWPLGRIMQLPEWCFGRKWWVGVGLATSLAADGFFISVFPFPDVFVVWDVVIHSLEPAGATSLQPSLVLMDHLPVVAEIPPARRLLEGYSLMPSTHDMSLPLGQVIHLGPMRVVVNSENERLAGVVRYLGATANSTVEFAVLISALPTEVPDWLVSG